MVQMKLNEPGRQKLGSENKNQNTQEVKNERFLIWTKQKKMRILGNFCLQQSDERTNQYKTRNVVNSLMSLLTILKNFRKCAFCFV